VFIKVRKVSWDLGGMVYVCMVLTKKAKYALNALVYLSKRADVQPVTSERIAQENKIPKKFLESILIDIYRLGIF
jgi:DNA-binding IscR family transcriptional regulator